MLMQACKETSRLLKLKMPAAISFLQPIIIMIITTVVRMTLPTLLGKALMQSLVLPKVQ